MFFYCSQKSKMENSEKDTINNNLHDLIENTVCNVSFISILEQFGLLTKNESMSLSSENRGINSERAYTLYSLLQTRTQSYSVLKDALLRTCQTGAFQILIKSENCNYSKYKRLEPFYEECVHRIGNTVTVYKGKFGTREALIKLCDYESNVTLSQMTNELDMLARLDWHENIVRCFIGKFLSYKFQQRFAVALDYKCSLTEMLPLRGGTVDMRFSLVKQFLNAVVFLHEKHILHLNLQTDNLFINSRNSGPIILKLGEFGLSRQLADEEDLAFSVKLLKEQGAGSFFTPEVLKSSADVKLKGQWQNLEARVSYKTDVFCVGVIIVIIMTGHHPFGDEDEIICNIRRNQRRLNVESFSQMSCDCQRGLQNALSESPDTRPTSQQLKMSFES